MRSIRELGYVRVGAAVPEIRVADTIFNTKSMMDMMERAVQECVDILIFPELSLTGATCGDLYFQETLLRGAISGLEALLEASVKYPLLTAVGMPIECAGRLYDAVILICQGKILGVVPKLSGNNNRCFSMPAAAETELELLGQRVPFASNLLIRDKDDERICFAIAACEPISDMSASAFKAAEAGAAFIICPSAVPEVWGRGDRVSDAVRVISEAAGIGYVLCNAGITESTADTVYSGQALIYELGELLESSERFTMSGQLIFSDIDCQRISSQRIRSNLRCENDINMVQISSSIPSSASDTVRRYSKTPFIPEEKALNERCTEIFQMLSGALARRMHHTGISKMILGVSGGLDSTLALMIMEDTRRLLSLEKESLLCITMPGFGTTGQTYDNVIKLLQALDVPYREIGIRDSCIQHFHDIGHDPNLLDSAYENAQARERTQILMDIANQENGLVIGTGDLSELALGWCTYNGDHMSMYAVNSSIPKTLIPFLIRHKAYKTDNIELRDSLIAVTELPISPELLPPDDNGNMKQKTEDTVGPYILHDFFLYHYLVNGAGPDKLVYLASCAFGDEYDVKTIRKWLNLFFRRFFSQQFKRSCAPEGAGIGPVSLSPRSGIRMPGDAASNIWLRELEK